MRCALVLLIVLVGCTEEPGPAAPAPSPVAQPELTGSAGPDLSHVRVGQRYTFRLDQGGTQMDLAWEITAVRVDRIDYRATMLKNGTAIGSAGEVSWSVPSPPAPPPEDDEELPRPAAAVRYEQIELAGRLWTARVVESEGTRTWVATDGRTDSFPPLLKQETGGAVTTVLARLEEPR